MRAFGGLFLQLLLLAPLSGVAQFTYTTNEGAITITGYVGSGGNVTIPASISGLPVTGIGIDAFSVYPNVTGVSIPNTVTSIGQAAFSNCSLTNVALPGSVTNIGTFAFESGSLTNITVDPLNPAFSSQGGVLFDKKQQTLVQYPGGLGGDYVVPGGITRIGEGAFYDCYGLSAIAIPDSVVIIGDLAFNQCTNLGDASLGNGLTTIEGAAFSGCTGLTNITFGKSVVSIGDSAFFACSSLATVILPSTVASLGQQVFASCGNLSGAYFQGNAPSIGTGGFSADFATVYYLPGTDGWDATFGGLLTAPWTLPYPVILSNNASFGVQTNPFSFIVSWATNLDVVVEAASNLPATAWSPLQTNTLTSGWFYFSDPAWTNSTKRFYRVRSL